VKRKKWHCNTIHLPDYNPKTRSLVYELCSVMFTSPGSDRVRTSKSIAFIEQKPPSYVSCYPMIFVARVFSIAPSWVK